MKPKDRIVHRNMFLNCDDLLHHFTLNLGEAKAIKNKRGTNGETQMIVAATRD